MQEQLENIKKLEEAKNTIKETIDDHYVLSFLMKEIDKKIESENEKYNKMKNEIEMAKPILTISGKSVVLPSVLHRLKEKFEYEQIGEVIYAFDKRGVRDDGSLNTIAYAWMPYETTKRYLKKFVLIRMKFHRTVGGTNQDGLFLDCTFFSSPKNTLRCPGYVSPDIKPTGKYFPYIHEALQIIKKRKNIPSFKPF